MLSLQSSRSSQHTLSTKPCLTVVRSFKSLHFHYCYPPGTPPAEHASRLAPTRPPLVMPDAEHRSRQAPMRNGDPVKWRLRFQVFSRATTSPATVLIYSSPGSERVAESSHQSKLSSVVVNDPFSHTHAAPIPCPMPRYIGPRKEASRLLVTPQSPAA